MFPGGVRGTGRVAGGGGGGEERPPWLVKRQHNEYKNYFVLNKFEITEPNKGISQK